jgi:hypothetical protein
MRPLIALLLLSLVMPLGGCVLLAAGVIGAAIERQHQQWNYNRWNYYRQQHFYGDYYNRRR